MEFKSTNSKCDKVENVSNFPHENVKEKHLAGLGLCRKSQGDGLVPQRNGMLEMLKFFTRKQGKGEPFEQFLADLQRLVKMCGFADQETKLLKAQIVIGIESKSLQEQLLSEDISLEDTILYCKSAEALEQISRQSESREEFQTDEMEFRNLTESEIIEGQTDVELKNEVRWEDEFTEFENKEFSSPGEIGEHSDKPVQVIKTEEIFEDAENTSDENTGYSNWTENIGLEDVSTGMVPEIVDSRCRESTENVLAEFVNLMPNVPKEENLEENFDGNSGEQSNCGVENLSEVINQSDAPSTSLDADYYDLHQPTSSEEVMYLNMTDDLDPDLYQCAECQKSFKSYETWARHRRNSHGIEKPYKCSHCDKAFPRKDSLNIHERIHSRDRPYGCTYCKKAFARKDHLKSHLRTHLKIKPFQCSICNRSFPRRTNLVNHQVVHSGEKNHECKICGRQFARREYLLGHQNVHTDVKPFECHQCGKRFTLEANLTRHIRQNHSGEQPFACGECGKTFTRKDCLSLHLATHDTTKPFSCNICGKKFSRKAHLNAHSYSHVEQKPFRCLDCGKSFARNASLMRHNLVHSKVKPFDCEKCGRSFSRKAYLIVHSLTHLEVKPYNCSECGKEFIRKEHLARHKKSHHNVDAMDMVDTVLTN